MSLAHIGFDGAGCSSRVELSKEARDYVPMGGDEEAKIDLDDVPGSLLDSLNA